jgi:phage terminase small subunit
MYITEDGREFNLNEKQRQFCENYVKNKGNLARAYWKVYREGKAPYAGKEIENCSKNGSRLTRNDEVSRYLNYLQNTIEKETIAELKEVVGFLTDIVRGNPEVNYYKKKDEDGNVISKTLRTDYDDIKPSWAVKYLIEYYKTLQDEKTDYEFDIGFSGECKYDETKSKNFYEDIEKEYDDEPQNKNIKEYDKNED